MLAKAGEATKQETRIVPDQGVFLCEPQAKSEITKPH